MRSCCHQYFSSCSFPIVSSVSLFRSVVTVRFVELNTRSTSADIAGIDSRSIHICRMLDGIVDDLRSQLNMALLSPSSITGELI